MRINGERFHLRMLEIEALRDRAFWSSAAYLNMVFAGGQPAEDLRVAGGSVIRAIKQLRDSGEEW